MTRRRYALARQASGRINGAHLSLLRRTTAVPHLVTPVIFPNKFILDLVGFGWNLLTLIFITRYLSVSYKNVALRLPLALSSSFN